MCDKTVQSPPGCDTLHSFNLQKLPPSPKKISKPMKLASTHPSTKTVKQVNICGQKQMSWASMLALTYFVKTPV